MSRGHRSVGRAEWVMESYACNNPISSLSQVFVAQENSHAVLLQHVDLHCADVL